MRHQVRPVRRRRDLQAHALRRRPQARRALCREDLFEAGGIPLLMKTLLDAGFLHGDCITVTGRTIAENLAKVAWNPDQDVVHPATNPITKTGGVVGLKGNLAPEGAIVKVAGMAADRQSFTGPARCFDGEEACFEA